MSSVSTSEFGSDSEFTPEVFQGQFGTFTITPDDRQGVVRYRVALAIAALSFALGAGLLLGFGPQPWVLAALTPIYACFCLALGISLLMIHIYLRALHHLLQLFWIIGATSAIVIALADSQPLALVVYSYPLTLLGVGFTFAALTGIFFKEAFCFNRLETRLLTPLLPVLLGGHLLGWLSVGIEQILLESGAILFLIFAMRKITQAIPPDIGDKTVFTYLEQQRQTGVSTR